MKQNLTLLLRIDLYLYYFDLLNKQKETITFRKLKSAIWINIHQLYNMHKKKNKILARYIKISIQIVFTVDFNWIKINWIKEKYHPVKENTQLHFKEEKVRDGNISTS